MLASIQGNPPKVFVRAAWLSALANGPLLVVLLVVAFACGPQVPGGLAIYCHLGINQVVAIQFGRRRGVTVQAGIGAGASGTLLALL